MLIVRRAAVGHRVARVDGDIHQDLVDLHRVDLDGEAVGVEAQLELEVLADHAPEQRRELAHEIVQVDDAAVRGLRAREREQLPDERGPALRGGGDRMRALVPRLARQRRREPRRVAGDHGEQVVEVVCDAGGEAAEQLEALRLSQLLFELALPRPVEQVPPQGGGATVVLRDEKRDVFDADDAAVGPEEAIFRPEGLAARAGEPGLPGVEDALAVEFVAGARSRGRRACAPSYATRRTGARPRG